jgi:Toprim domain
MSAQLKSWAAALGGDVIGRGVNCPGPGHSARDRSLSVTPSAAAPDGFVVYSFVDDWQTCRDYVRVQLGLPAFRPGQAQERTVCSIAKQRDQAVKNSEEKDNASKAAWLWNNRRPIAEDCPAELYLRKARGYRGPIPSTIGYLPANGKHPPAMIAAFGFCEEPEPGVIDPPSEVAGVHITRLTSEGRKASIDPVKIMLGPMSGLPIVLAPANDLLAIDIAEGIEKGLLIQADTGAGMWAAGSAGNMPKIAAALPHYAECVTIWADRDETGLRLALEAARIIQARKIEVRIKGIPDG